MIPTIIGQDERQRVTALRKYALLDIPPEPALDDLTKLAATICETPIALLTLIDEQRQWCKARIGFEAEQTTLEISFCAHAPVRPELFVVPDATRDTRFAQNPLVTGEPSFRFYAGAPLITPDGIGLGTLCVIDREARVLSSTQAEALLVLSRQVMAHLELRRQARELAAGERLLRTIYDSEPECMKVLNRDGSLRMMNRAGLEIIEADSFEEVAGQCLYALLPPEDRPRFEALAWRVFRGETATLEFQLIGLKGAARWLETHAAPLRDERGEVTGLLGITRDITERREAEEKLRASEKRYRDFMNGVPVAAYVTEADGTIALFNPAAVAMWGREPAPGEKWCGAHRLFTADASPIRHDECPMAQAILENRTISGAEAMGERPDGTRFSFLANATPFRDDSGALIGAMNALIDITERKVAEDAIRKYETIFQHAGWGMVIADAETHVLTHVNPAYARMHGYRVEEMIGMNLADTFVPAERPEIPRIVEAAHTRGRHIYESMHLRKDGSHFPCQTDVTAYRDAGGRVLFRAATFEDITERRDAEGALRRQAALLDQTYDAVFAWSLDGAIVYWNEGAERLYGVAAAQAAGCAPHELLATEFPESLEHCREVLARTGSWHGELHQQARDGSRRIVECRMNLVHESDGVLVLETNRDITDRHQAEAALRATEANYRTLVESAADGILVSDAQGRMLEVNAEGCRLFGYAREEFLTLHVGEIVALPERPRIIPEIARLGIGTVTRSEWQCRHKDGRHFPVEVSATVLPDGRLLGILRDVTERQRAGERMRRLIESDVQGVIFWNRLGGITEANDAFLKIVGYTREDLAAGSVNWQTMTPPQEADSDQRALAEIAAKGSCTAYEKEFIRKDGSHVPVLIGAASFRDGPEEGVAFVLDLTERKMLEQQFLRAQRMESIGTLAGGIAHDLNNMLSPIITAIDLLELRFTDPDSRELLSILNASAQRGADMVRQVLTFARGLESRRTEVPLGKIVRDIEKIANDTFLKNIEVRTSVPPDLWTVAGDPTQIHQVLLNLCVNARDAMPRGGTLTISLENAMLDGRAVRLNPEVKAGAYVQLRVRDSGTGISPEVIDKIFDPFFTTKEIGKGTGLGLSTSLAIVKNHGGFIGVETVPRKGTTFCVHLPAQPAKPHSAVATRAIEMPRGNSELILVVDDETPVRLIMQRTLETFGYRVILASDGVAAVAAFTGRRKEIALVVTDMMMPVMDGPATIEALRRINPSVPIIAASGLATRGQADRIAELGVDYFLVKPFTAETLLTVVHQVLSARS